MTIAMVAEVKVHLVKLQVFHNTEWPNIPEVPNRKFHLVICDDANKTSWNGPEIKLVDRNRANFVQKTFRNFKL